MENTDGRLGAILWDYRGLKLTYYPVAREDGSFDVYDSVDEDGAPKSDRVTAIFDYADALANELRRRLPETGHLAEEAQRQGAQRQDAPPMRQQAPQRQQYAPQGEPCPECGGETQWGPWKNIGGKQKRPLECASGCKKPGSNYPLTVRWEQGR